MAIPCQVRGNSPGLCAWRSFSRDTRFWEKFECHPLKGGPSSAKTPRMHEKKSFFNFSRLLPMF